MTYTTHDSKAKSKNSNFSMCMKILFLALFIAGVVIIILSFFESASQKERLEMLGAQVDLKPTISFFVMLILTIVCGIVSINIPISRAIDNSNVEDGSALPDTIHEDHSHHDDTPNISVSSSFDFKDSPHHDDTPNIPVSLPSDFKDPPHLGDTPNKPISNGKLIIKFNEKPNTDSKKDDVPQKEDVDIPGGFFKGGDL